MPHWSARGTTAVLPAEPRRDLPDTDVTVTRCRAPRAGEHVNQDRSLTQPQAGDAGQNGEPIAAGVHTQLLCAGRAFVGDTHLRHSHAVQRAFAGQEPGRHPWQVLGLWPDHHVAVLGRLDELIERGAERPGDGDQLIEGDSAVPGLDAAQSRRAEVAARGEGVQ
jgi:hypothetical protein